MKKILYNILTISFIALSLISCKKDDPKPESEPTATVESSISGFEKWRYGDKELKISFTKEDGVVNGFELPDLSNVTTSFTTTGDKITSIDQTVDGATKNYTFTYDGDKLTNIGGSADYTFEFDVNNTIVQINKGTSTFYELTYTGNNITAIKQIQGAAVTNFTLEYDNEVNPFYNNVNLRAFTIGPRLFYSSPNNWALDYLLTLTENNVTKITYDSNEYNNTYFRTGSEIDSVIQTWTVTPDAPLTYKLLY